MQWQIEPGIETQEQDGGLVLRVTGDLIRDMPRLWRQAVRDQLEARLEADRLVIDLADLSRLGSWGEKRIRSLASSVVGHGGRVAVVTDAQRSAMYAGLRIELRSINPAVCITEDRAEALAKIKRDQ